MGLGLDAAQDQLQVLVQQRVHVGEAILAQLLLPTALDLLGHLPRLCLAGDPLELVVAQLLDLAQVCGGFVFHGLQGLFLLLLLHLQLDFLLGDFLLGFLDHRLDFLEFEVVFGEGVFELLFEFVHFFLVVLVGLGVRVGLGLECAFI